MSCIIQCDVCQKQVTDDSDEEANWFHNNEYELDACSQECYVKLCNKLYSEECNKLYSEENEEVK